MLRLMLILAMLLSGFGSAYGASSPASDTVMKAPMTTERFLSYMKRFNAQDPAFVDYYADDIVFDRGEAGVLRGKAEILAFYNDTWSRIDERIWLDAIAIDPVNGTMMVDLSVELLAREDPAKDSVVRLKRGDHLLLREVLIYGISHGFITSIRAPEHYSRLTPAGGGPFPASTFSGEPTPLVKKAIEDVYYDYAACFSQTILDCLDRFVADDVQFVSQSLPLLTGKKQLMSFFGDLRKSLSENLSIHGFRYENGWFFVDLSNTLTIHKPIADLGGNAYAPGNYALRGEVAYQIVDGKIRRIYDGVNPF